MMASTALLYRFAPDRDEPEWRWVSPRAIVATFRWLLGLVAFTAHVSDFARYDKTYGSLRRVVVLRPWLYLTFFVVPFGGVINQQYELEIDRDEPA